MFFNYSGMFHYQQEFNPNVESANSGFKAISYSQDFSMTGWWQNINTVAITTSSPVLGSWPVWNNSYNNQEIRIQQGWQDGEALPWLWTGRGQDYTLTLSATKSLPVAYGDAMMQGLLGFRFEHILSGERLWVQMRTFNSAGDAPRLEIAQDMHTGTDYMVNAQGLEGDYLNFFNIDQVRDTTWINQTGIDFSMTRGQFTNLLQHTNNTLGINLDDESGYWELDFVHVAIEQASAIDGVANPWNLGSDGHMQMQVSEFQLEGF